MYTVITRLELSKLLPTVFLEHCLKATALGRGAYKLFTPPWVEILARHRNLENLSLCPAAAFLLLPQWRPNCGIWLSYSCCKETSGAVEGRPVLTLLEALCALPVVVLLFLPLEAAALGTPSRLVLSPSSPGLWIPPAQSVPTFFPITTHGFIFMEEPAQSEGDRLWCWPSKAQGSSVLVFQVGSGPICSPLFVPAAFPSG